MSGEIEAIGALANGGLIANAMASEGSREGEQLHTCQNCGATLAGPFCHACGQSGHVHRTLGHLAEEFAHGMFHVESKGWRTLPMLIVNPGRLTREYIHGRRARYIAPLALFLFTVFLTFFMFGITGGQVVGSSDKPEVQRAEAASALKEAEKDLATESKDPDTPAVTRAALRQSVTIAQARLAALAASPVGVTARTDKSVVMNAGPDWAEALKRQNARGKFKINTGYARFDARIHHALEDPEFTAYKVEEKASKLSFLLVPLTLPIIWLLFIGRRGFNLYDHTVFALYSLSFMSLLVVVMLLLGSIGLGTPASLLLLAPAVHMFAQLKGTYGLTTRGALWRMVVLGITCMVALGLFFSLMLLVGLID